MQITKEGRGKEKIKTRTDSERRAKSENRIRVRVEEQTEGKRKRRLRKVEGKYTLSVKGREGGREVSEVVLFMNAAGRGGGRYSEREGGEECRRGGRGDSTWRGV